MTDPTSSDRGLDRDPVPQPPAPGSPPAGPAGPAEPAGPVTVPAAPLADVEPVVPARAGGRRPALLGYLGIAILGIAIGAGGLALVAGGLGRAAPSPTPAPSAAPADNAIGSAAAPVTLEIWADYQCPFCRLEDLLFQGAVVRQYVLPGIVRIVYRDFAFLGPESTAAAVAARCAGAQDPAARLRYHDALYTFQQGENQGRFARANLLQIAQIVGVPDATAFAACLDDPAVAQAVADETAAGRNVGVVSTPTLRLRGPGGERVLTGATDAWPTLRDAIDAVAAAPSPSPSGSAGPAPSGSAGGASPEASPSPATSASPTP